MESSKRTLRFYFRELYKKTGLNWTSDNEAEIDDILQGVYEAVIEDAVLEIKREWNGLTKTDSML